MVALALIVGIISVASLAFGIMGLNQYSKLQAADSKPTVEKSYIWWGSVIMIMIGVLALVALIYMLWSSGLFVGSAKPGPVMSTPAPVQQTVTAPLPVNEGSLISPKSPRSISRPSAVGTAAL